MIVGTLWSIYKEELNYYAQLYGLRMWIEYGFKQVKNELGWADFRLTDYASIERWWGDSLQCLSSS